jgi:hypothetical protein
LLFCFDFLRNVDKLDGNQRSKQNQVFLKTIHLKLMLAKKSDDEPKKESKHRYETETKLDF